MNESDVSWPVRALDLEANSLEERSSPIQVGGAVWSGPNHPNSVWSTPIRSHRRVATLRPLKPGIGQGAWHRHGRNCGRPAGARRCQPPQPETWHRSGFARQRPLTIPVGSACCLRQATSSRARPLAIGTPLCAACPKRTAGARWPVRKQHGRGTGPGWTRNSSWEPSRQGLTSGTDPAALQADVARIAAG